MNTIFCDKCHKIPCIYHSFITNLFVSFGVIHASYEIFIKQGIIECYSEENIICGRLYAYMERDYLTERNNYKWEVNDAKLELYFSSFDTYTSQRIIEDIIKDLNYFYKEEYELLSKHGVHIK